MQTRVMAAILEVTLAQVPLDVSNPASITTVGLPVPIHARYSLRFPVLISPAVGAWVPLIVGNGTCVAVAVGGRAVAVAGRLVAVGVTIVGVAVGRWPTDVFFDEL